MIVNTRPTILANKTNDLLACSGIEFIHEPLTKILGISPPNQALEKLQQLDSYDAIIFTSQSAAKFGSAQPIPLKIPGVMNPTLSAFSKSGVDLPIGQKILLSVGGKDLLLFTVTDSIPNGARVNVADLIDRALNKKD